MQCTYSTLYYYIYDKAEIVHGRKRVTIVICLLRAGMAAAEKAPRETRSRCGAAAIAAVAGYNKVEPIPTWMAVGRTDGRFHLLLLLEHILPQGMDLLLARIYIIHDNCFCLSIGFVLSCV